MTRTVESFSLWLDDFDAVLTEADPVTHVENRLLDRLNRPERLLRWAIVAVEDSGKHPRSFRCEGAYLKCDSISL